MMKTTKFAKYINILVVGMLLLAFLPVYPASAASPVISINIAESIVRHDTYAPANPTTNGTVAPGIVSGTGTITLTNNADLTLANVVLVFNAGNTNTWGRDTGDTVSSIVTNGRVEIPSFPSGGVVHVTYSLVPGSASPPVTLTSTYTQNSVTDNLASTTTIHLTATLNPAALPAGMTSLTPTITLQSADNLARGTHDGTLPDWVLSSTSTTPASTSGTDSSSTIAWTPALSTTTTTSSINITAKVNDVPALNDGLGGVSLNDIATSTVTYTITSDVGTSSGITLSSASANSPEVKSTIKKEFTNGEWKFTPEVSVSDTTAITYELTSISEWAVDSSSLNTSIASKEIDAASHDSSHDPWPVTLDHMHPLFTGIGSELLTFPYNGVPVGFMKPSIQIQNSQDQYPRTAISTAAGVTLLKKIFVINGYQVEASKTIETGNAESGGQWYHIQIVVRNIGTAPTPPNVVIYDIVPTGFIWLAPTSPTNFNVAYTGYTSVTSGRAYYWNIGSLDAGALYTISYDVFGYGDYKVSDLYVVGVDPAQSLNLQTTPILSNAATIVNANFETLAALGAAGLLVVGMVGNVRRKQ